MFGGKHMNKRLKSLLAVVLIAAMAMPMMSCSQLQDFLGSDGGRSRHERRRDRDDDEDDEEDEEEEEETEETTEAEDPTPTATPAPTPAVSNVVNGFDMTDLEYPDHVPTVDEIHPAHANGTVTGQDASDLLDQIERDLLNDSLSADYVDYKIMFDDPSAFGIEPSDVTWGEFDLDPTDDIAFVQEKLDLLYTIDYESLDYQDRAFYDKVVYDLELSLYMLQYDAFDYYEPVLDPLLGPQCNLLFILEVLDFETVEDAENYILLIEDTDRYFDELVAFEEERASRGFTCTDSVYEDMVQSFDGLVAQEDDCFLYESFETRLDGIQGLSDADRTRLIDAHNDAMHNSFFPEFQECSDRISALIGSGGVQQGVCNYPGGDAYYAVRFMSYANSTKSIDQTKTEVETLINDSFSTMLSIMYSGDQSWADEYENHYYNLGSVEDNLDYLYTAVQPDFPDLPDHEYFVNEVPEALQDNFSPAAYLGYHLDTFTSNMIISNPSGVNETFGITCAHEGYPGHMFQSVYTRSVCEHPYLYIADSVGYAEGWATYVENYSFKYFCENENAQILLTIDNEFPLMLYARVDIGINYEGWTSDDVMNYFAGLGMSPSQDGIEEMCQLFTNQPGYGIKYGVGFLNTTELMQSAREQFPNATDEEIHTAYLNSLPLTFEQIQTRMFEALS